MYQPSQNLTHRLIPLAASIGVLLFAAGVSVAFASLNFTGTSISGDSGIVIDGPGTISIGTASSTGITIGSNWEMPLSFPTGLELTDPSLSLNAAQGTSTGNLPYYSYLGEYNTGQGGLWINAGADATNATISGVTFDVDMYSTSSLPMRGNQAFLINCYRPGTPDGNYCLDGETMFAVANDYTPNGYGDYTPTPLTVVSAANGNAGGFPTGGGRVLINRNTSAGASSTLDILQVYPDRPGIRYQEASSQTADPFEIYASDNTTLLANINSAGQGAFEGLNINGTSTPSYFAGNVGIGTAAPSTTLQVASASSTIRIGASALPGCLEMGNSNGSAGINYVTFLNGVMTATTTKPNNCQ